MRPGMAEPSPRWDKEIQQMSTIFSSIFYNDDDEAIDSLAHSHAMLRPCVCVCVFAQLLCTTLPVAGSAKTRTTWPEFSLIPLNCTHLPLTLWAVQKKEEEEEENTHTHCFQCEKTIHTQFRCIVLRSVCVCTIDTVELSNEKNAAGCRFSYFSPNSFTTLSFINLYTHKRPLYRRVYSVCVCVWLWLCVFN